MSLKSNVRLCVLLLPLGLFAQEAVPASAQAAVEQPSTHALEPGTPASATPDGAGIETGKRIFGVLPNYKTVEKMTVAYQPISAHEKFMIATKDSFDWPEFFVAGAMSGLNQITAQDPEWGQGVQGYAKRYAASVADQTISNYLTEAILPSVLHDDPRYFRLGEGSAVHRIAHALSWVIITRSDSNHSTLNVPELLGSGASAAIGTMYYPVQERTGGSVRDRFVTQVSFDAASSVLKEYWPDIRRVLFKQHQ